MKDFDIRPDGSIVSDPEALRRVLGWMQRKYREDVERRDGVGSPLLMDFVYAVGESVRIREVLPGAEVPGQRPERLWVSVMEAAPLLGCSARWVRELARRGKIPSRRVGLIYLIDVTDLKE
ncbi:helix-turn-helix domain-containing protein [Microbacterium xylanilyticum]